MKKRSRSKSYWWGHLQTIPGAVVLIAGYVTPKNFPDLPAWAYGAALVLGGLVTYLLREFTQEPLK